MRPGDTVMLREGGEAQVSSVTDNEEHADVYNFAVSEFHTYFVGVMGVWVHNAAPVYLCGVCNVGVEAPKSVFDLRTPEADASGQAVIKVMNEFVPSAKSQVVQVFTHEDETVTVGISVNLNAQSTINRIQQLQSALDDTYGADSYFVSSKTLDGTAGVLRGYSEDGTMAGNAPGVCAEPKASIGAARTQSPITSSATLWRGAGPNPYPYAGPNASELSGNQMGPCLTCALGSNQKIYSDIASANSNPWGF